MRTFGEWLDAAGFKLDNEGCYCISHSQDVLDWPVVGEPSRPCPTCGGKPPAPKWNAARFDKLTSCITNPEDVRREPCSTCAGTGSVGGPVAVVMPEAVERIAMMLCEGDPDSPTWGDCLERTREHYRETACAIALALFPGGVEFAEAVGRAIVLRGGQAPAGVGYIPASPTDLLYPAIEQPGGSLRVNGRTVAVLRKEVAK